MKDKIRKSLRYSFLDGAFFSTMFGCGDTYFSPYAIFLKATNLEIGLLAALPGFFASLFQLRAPELTARFGRKTFMTATALLQALIYIPIILIPFVLASNPVPYLIAAVSLYSIAYSLSLPAWASIMTQYLPRGSRGKYFSWRQRTTGFITVGATFAAGLVLYLFPKTSVWGFTCIMSAAMAARFFSTYNLSKMHEPKLVEKPEAYFSFWDFIRRAKKSNYAKFVFFAGSISFSVFLASPFFTVYMLRELKFDYLTFVSISITPTIAMLLSLPAWGRHTDKVGCVRVMRFTSLLLPLLPVLWLVSSSKIYLVMIQIFGGFVWGGFNLAASNFIYDAVSEGKRVRGVSYFNLVNGLGIFTGAVLGGLLVSKLPPILGSSLLTIFLISGILRLLFRFYFMPKIKEVKPVLGMSNLELFFSVTGIKQLPASGTASKLD